MIDVFHAIAACDDLIHYWDVAKHADGGVLVHASSQRHFRSEPEAIDRGHEIAQRLGRPGYDLRSVSATARTNGTSGDGWHAFVEVVITPSGVRSPGD